jgi:hypothetical protein
VGQCHQDRACGRVTDESSAVLPGVTVTVTQMETGFSRTVVTNDNGTALG